MYSDLSFDELGVIFGFVSWHDYNAILLSCKAFKKLFTYDQFIECNKYFDAYRSSWNCGISFGTDEIIMKILSKHGSYLRMVNNPTEEMCIVAVKSSYDAITYIKNPSDKIKLIAVQSSSFALQHIESPTEEICLTALSSGGQALEYIKNPTEEMCWSAIRKCGWAIKYINNPTREMCIEAIKISPRSIKYVPQTEEFCWLSLTTNPGALIYITNPTDDMVIYAVGEDHRLIQDKENISHTLKLATISRNPSVINFINNPTNEMIIEAAKHNALIKRNLTKSRSMELLPYVGDMIERVEQNEENCLIAVRQNPHSIRLIKYPSFAVCCEALRLDPNVLQHIKFATDDMKKN